MGLGKECGSSSPWLFTREQKTFAADDDDCRFSQPEQFGGLRLNAHPHRETRGQMDPVESALNIGQTSWRAATDQICSWSHSKAHAVDHPPEGHIPPRQHIHVRLHASPDVPDLRFATIRHRPPYTDVDHSNEM